MTRTHASSIVVATMALGLRAAPLVGADVTLQFYDRTGAAINAAGARSLMTDGAAGWANDALVDPTTLQVLIPHPLVDAPGGLAFTVPATPAALAVNWPTTRGFSLLVLDAGGAGFAAAATIDFTFQAASDVARRLDDAITARPDYARSSTFDAALASGRAHLAAARAAGDEPTRGKEGALALDDLAAAQGLLLEEYGPAFARSRLATTRPWIGFTLDTLDNAVAALDTARSIGGVDTWVRIVCAAASAPADYVDVVAAAQARGIRVMLQPVDSSEVQTLTRAQYRARFTAFVDAFADVDAWEVGNEVDGDWLGSGVSDKIADAAAYVRAQRPTAQSVLTLYWQVGTSTPPFAMFNWVRANLPASTRASLDEVLVSLYVEDAPLDLAFDAMMRVLQAEFPAQRVGLGELGYWDADTAKAWWAFDQADTTAARHRVASWYYAAALGYPRSVGGCFWWYAAEEMTSDAALAAAVRDVVARMDTGAGTTGSTTTGSVTTGATTTAGSTTGAATSGGSASNGSTNGSASSHHGACGAGGAAMFTAGLVLAVSRRRAR